MLTTFNCWQKFKCQQLQSRGPRTGIWNSCCRQLCSPVLSGGESLLIQVVMPVCDKRGWCFSLGNTLCIVHSSTHGSKAHKASSGIQHSQYSHFLFHYLLETSNSQPSCAQWWSLIKTAWSTAFGGFMEPGKTHEPSPGFMPQKHSKDRASEDPAMERNKLCHLPVCR